ncbi:MAG TPA: hypothetical protein VMS22_19840 [Candidatus Eisenbacteria bacterium]|nr:hypothetical protein [Candidatus Eisenbacteria bacterium]
MIGRKIVLGLTALTLCLGLAASGAYAKPCPKKCHTELTACRTSCLELKGKAKRMCIKDCKQPIIALCKERKSPTSCSPSGAFLDELTY